MANGSSRRRMPLAQRRSMARDRSGGVAVYVALIAFVTFGLIGLAVDATRAMIVRSESQAAADAAALAAGSQLDGTSTAIARADAAIEDLITNRQGLASTGAGEVTIANVRYLVGLPGNDSAAITDDFVTSNPLEARFVEVTTAPLTHINTFLRAAGAVDPVDITTSAVSGGSQMVCRAQPLMICNPGEYTTIGDIFDVEAWRGRQVRLVSQSSGAYVPGNFGYLSPGANGANALAEALASTNGANICYGPTVQTEPGQNNGARTALNTRFGIYENPQFGGGARNNPLYAPDVNVRTMPRDLVFSGPGNRFGNGYWNCLTYWNANHASSGVQRPAACTNNTNSISRYEIYEYEIANNRSLPPPQNAANKMAQRRIVYVAVVNCREHNIAGRTDAPATTYLKIFITEPVTSPSNVELVGEIVDVVQVGADDGVLHEIVQLYR
ncbi:MAG: pilus assembly protein TadG-related protein [Hyphomonadaceae bacterium]